MENYNLFIVKRKGLLWTSSVVFLPCWIKNWTLPIGLLAGSAKQPHVVCVAIENECIGIATYSSTCAWGTAWPDLWLLELEGAVGSSFLPSNYHDCWKEADMKLVNTVPTEENVILGGIRPVRLLLWHAGWSYTIELNHPKQRWRLEDNFPFLYVFFFSPSGWSQPIFRRHFLSF